MFTSRRQNLHSFLTSKSHAILSAVKAFFLAVALWLHRQRCAICWKVLRTRSESSSKHDSQGWRHIQRGWTFQKNSQKKGETCREESAEPMLDSTQNSVSIRSRRSCWRQSSTVSECRCGATSKLFLFLKEETVCNIKICPMIYDIWYMYCNA